MIGEFYMGIKIYITRHGQTLWNVEKRMQGWNDSPLTKLGIKQAQCLQQRLDDIQIDVIYSSPIKRAYNTAKIVRGTKSIPIITDNRLKELNMGKWEGMLQKDIEDKYKEQLYNFWNEPSKYVPIGGETFQQVKDRGQDFINYLIKKYNDKNILIVTHTMAIKGIMNYIEKSSIKRFWGPPFIEPTSLTIVNIEDNKFHILQNADASHLGILRGKNIV